MANLVRRREVEPSLGTLGTWDPFEVMREMMSFDPFQRLERAIIPLAGRRPFLPDFDVRETKDSYIFKADLPGMKEEEIDVSVTGNRLTISGSRQREEEHKDEQYYAVERSYGSFTRTFTIPEGCDLEHIAAELKDGVLTLVAPKKEEVKAKHISLKELKGKVAEKLRS